MNTPEETKHFNDRVMERLISNTGVGVPVGYESSPQQYELVGHYIIPNEVIMDVQNKIKILQSAKIPNNKDYGIKVTQIPINPATINYISSHNINTVKGKNLLFIAPPGRDESNGNILYIILRKGKLFTFMFMKNYIKIDANKLRVDYILTNWDAIKNNQVR